MWIILTAFKFPVDAASVPPKIVSPFTTLNFRALNGDGFIKSLWNSTVLTVRTTVATLVVGVPAGYAFARGKFVGSTVPRGVPALQPDGAAGDLHHPAVPVLP